MIKQIVMTLWTAAMGTTGKEASFGAIVAATGVVISEWLGGWDKAQQVLVVLIIADYISGVLVALKKRSLSSDVMFWGGIRKITVLFIIGLAFLIDGWVNIEKPIFGTLALFFYVGREGLSVMENLSLLGVPLPRSLKTFLQVLKRKGDEEIKNSKEK